ncbi:MAG: glycosyltransferase family 2 protein, partial [Gemmatimonadetes bacterium]|nr:glycosyltransferase family 2 protein [Gemmatimonadota bacterium]
RSTGPSKPGLPRATDACDSSRGVAVVVAIVVSYQPERSLLRNVEALLPQVGSVVVVDNGSVGESRQWLEPLRAAAGVKVVDLGENLGIAAALNEGIRQARGLGAQWVLTMDQDSTVPTGFVARLLAAYEASRKSGRVAIVAPRYLDQSTGLEHSFAKNRDDSRGWAAVEMTLTSGNLVRLDALDAIGHFDEALFIDYVDMEFCLRCRAAGYAIVEASGATLLHRLGNASRHRVLGRTVAATNHSVLRRYYISRNRVALYRRFLWSRPGWVANDLFIWTREIVKIASFEEDRPAKLRAMIRGAWHGLRGRMGCLDD